jgi:hypothetical protein
MGRFKSILVAASPGHLEPSTLAPSTSPGVEGAGVVELLACLHAAPDASHCNHGPQGDLPSWGLGALGNEDVSMHLHQLAHLPLGSAFGR